MDNLANAKVMCSAQTPAEQRMWYHLRAHRFLGLKFKRQKPIGPYVVDFICLEQHLVIEVDGAQHGDQVTYDRQRDHWLAAQGLTVLRFWNHDVLNRPEAVLEQIRLIVEAPSPPAPLP